MLIGGHCLSGMKTGSAGVKFIKSILRQLGFDSLAEWRAKHLKDGIPGDWRSETRDADQFCRVQTLAGPQLTKISNRCEEVMPVR